GAFATGAFDTVFAGFAADFAGAFADGFAVFLLGIVLLLFFEVGADARASFFDALRIADVFLVPLSLEPLSFILEFFL
ncbi:MAG: hypothetical protein IJ935_04395, partial [Afipia sp.]|nr:hypothetical protein [Afipia sp.]